MVPTSSDESKLKTFQWPSQDQISGYKDFYGELHDANIQKKHTIYVVTFCFFAFGTPLYT